MAKSKDKSKRNFASFNLNEAMKFIGIEKIFLWTIHATPRKPSDFFHEHLRRLTISFDIKRTERSKELLVDAYCGEVLIDYPMLKFGNRHPFQARN